MHGGKVASGNMKGLQWMYPTELQKDYQKDSPHYLSKLSKFARFRGLSGLNKENSG